VRWHEPATYRNTVSGRGIEEGIPARDCEHLRSLVPIAPEVGARTPPGFAGFNTLLVSKVRRHTCIRATPLWLRSNG
jgi:hypothetical protein